MDKLRAEALAKQICGSEVAGWVVDSLIDNGKSAAVFSATKSSVTAALKIMDPEIIQRAGKAKQLARLHLQEKCYEFDHPHLVKIYEVGECKTTGHLYVAMENIPCRSLAEFLSTFPDEKIFPVISQIAKAAHFLETKRLAHRDIKIDNVVVDNQLTHAVLLDMGVLKPHAGGDLTGTGFEFVGTLQYSPPEFAEGREKKDLDGWRAITFYQLGAVLHDLIMKRRLFEEYTQSAGRIMQAINHVIPIIESEAVSNHLVRLARHCLHKDPEFRLRVVRWEDFFEMPHPSKSAAELKERFRQKISALELMPNAATSEKSVARNLNQYLYSVDSLVRDICIGSSLIPPITIIHKHENDSKVHLVIKAGPKNSITLFNELVIVLTFEILDHANEAVEIKGAAFINGHPEKLTTEDSAPIFQGHFRLEEMQHPLDEFLHRALLSATEFPSKLQTNQRISLTH